MILTCGPDGGRLLAPPINLRKSRGGAPPSFLPISRGAVQSASAFWVSKLALNDCAANSAQRRSAARVQTKRDLSASVEMTVDAEAEFKETVIPSAARGRSRGISFRFRSRSPAEVLNDYDSVATI